LYLRVRDLPSPCFVFKKMLELSQIQQLAIKPAHLTEVRTGVQHGKRLQFHSDSTIEELPSDSYLSDFFKWIGGTEVLPGILPADKFDTFKSLLTYPLPTTELLENIYTNLKRVFDGKNANERYLFTDKQLGEDFKEFFNSDKFKAEAFEAMKNSIDSIVVVDLPSDANEQSTSPEPYYYFVEIDHVIDVQVDKDNQIEYVIFLDGEGSTVCIDDTYWRVFTGERDKLILKTEVKHGLEAAPARMLWTDRLKSRNFINRRSPITTSLGELDWLLFHRISKRHLDLYASYPIYVSYNTEEKKTGTPGEEGKFVRNPKGKKLMGAGSYIKVPAPQAKEDPDLMNNPLKVIPAERESLDYNTEEETRLADKIFKSCVGFDGDPKNDQAKNVKQVKSSFESRKDILLSLKLNFEEIHKWTASTLAQLRYGEKFSSAEVDYGTEFYLQNENDILNDISNAKSYQAPEAIISDLTGAYFDTKYRIDSETKERVGIIMDLDPYPTKSVTDTLAVYTAGLISKETMLIKLNLDAYVRRFERENLPVTEFGEGMDYFKKIDIINKQLNSYASEQAKETAGNPGQPESTIPDATGRRAPLPPAGG
jgi:hypothetical protein